MSLTLSDNALESAMQAAKYMFSCAAYSVAVDVLNMGSSVPKPRDLISKLTVLQSAWDYSYRATIPEYDSDLFVLRVLTPGPTGVLYDIIQCNLHNQLGMSFITFVSEFASLLPWAQHILSCMSRTEDYSDMEKALNRVRNSYRDLLDQVCMTNHILTTKTHAHRLARLPIMLHEAGVISTTASVHPGMPQCLSFGTAFGLFVVDAFYRFDNYFQGSFSPGAKTEDTIDLLARQQSA